MTKHLTAIQIIEAKRLHEENKLSYREIAAKLGVSQVAIGYHVGKKIADYQKSRSTKQYFRGKPVITGKTVPTVSNVPMKGNDTQS